MNNRLTFQVGLFLVLGDLHPRSLVFTFKQKGEVGYKTVLTRDA
jgi:hypothetical protein